MLSLILVLKVFLSPSEMVSGKLKDEVYFKNRQKLHHKNKFPIQNYMRKYAKNIKSKNAFLDPKSTLSYKNDILLKKFAL